jgi:hypothetical protein
MIAAAATLALLAVPALGAARDGATIVNSGSTNAVGWNIKIWSDGAGSVAKTGGEPRAFVLPGSATGRFFADAKAARMAARSGGGCMKSASFGTRTFVQWHGWQSADLSCPASGPANRTLASDLDGIENAADIASLQTGRLIRIPSEPRRVEAPTPTATP